MIEIKNVTKKFGNFTAVDNIDVKVQEGEVFAFLGPNGAGKSTTIKMLTTLLSPNSGDIFLNGHNVVENPHETRKSFGIVFQDPSLDNELTAYENMQFHAILYKLARDVYKKRIVELLNLVELYDRKDSYVKNFSWGMKRRLEIARGLLHHPKVLFLDEPTLGLDPQTRNHIWTYISDLNKKEGVTIFFTTHHMEEVERIAQRVAIIDHGKIVITGTIEEIVSETGAKNLEDAFISLTGSKIREEAGDVGLNQMRISNKLMR
ncbi:MAG: ATP-binding cassette domain-containing protein [Candidatus Staskawiczbacteria bacterium]|nr:ATP-binding cassette domain-containing protein [Candidatus Staskawiczbacteria bacterium]